jgi:hypothetical protein
MGKYLIPTNDNGKPKGIAFIGGESEIETTAGDGRTLDLKFKNTLLDSRVVVTTSYPYFVTGKTYNENYLHFSENFSEFVVRNEEYTSLFGSTPETIATGWSHFNIQTALSSVDGPFGPQSKATIVALNNPLTAIGGCELRMVRTPLTVPIALPNRFTFSIYVRKAFTVPGGELISTTDQPFRVSLSFTSEGDQQVVLASSTFNINSETIESFTYANTSQISAVGNGWYRLSITTSVDAPAGLQAEVNKDTRLVVKILGAPNNPGFQGMYIFGAQLSNTALPIPYVRSEYPQNYADINAITTTATLSRFPLKRCRPINALLQSENLSTLPWRVDTKGPSNTVTRTANFATAPNGTQTATRLQMALGSQQFVDPEDGPSVTRCGVYQALVGGVVAAEVAGAQTNLKTFSIWLKSNTGANQVVALGPHDLHKVVVGPEWKKYTIVSNNRDVITPPSYGCGIYLMGTSAASQPVDILAWGAQLSLDAAKDNPYVPTTSSYLYEAPIDYEPLTGELRGIRLEPAGTNLLTDSYGISAFIVWTSLFNGGGNPTYVGNLDRVTSVIGGATFQTPYYPALWAEPLSIFMGLSNRAMDHGLKRYVNFTAGTQYTFSAYFRPLRYGKDGNPNKNYINVILGIKEQNELQENGAVSTAIRARFIIDPSPTTSFGQKGTTAVLEGGAGTSSKLEQVGNNVWRCSITFTADRTEPDALIIQAEKDGVGVFFNPNTDETGILFSAPQLEIGPKATSYVLTTSTGSASRPATEYQVFSSSGNWLTSTNPCSVVVDFKANSSSSSQDVFKIRTTDNSQFVALQQSGSASMTLTSVVDGSAAVQTSTVSTGLAFDAYHGYGYSMNVASFIRSLNGSTIASNNLSKNQQVSGNFEVLNIGTSTFDGWIRRLTFFPTALTQSELNALTTVVQIGPS